MRILVVEDEKILCDTIVRSLSRLAYSVDSCYDGGGTPWSFWPLKITIWWCWT